MRTLQEQIQYDLLTINLDNITKFREHAESLIYKYAKPKFCSVDIVGDLYVEGSFDKHEYAFLMLAQHMFIEAAKIINYREFDNEIVQ